MANVLIPLADGVEEMEAVIIIDVLRRARWTVTTASITESTTITGSRGVKLIADRLWSAFAPDAYDAIILPGGSDGTHALMACNAVLETIRRYNSMQRLVAALCAGPLVLNAAGILEGRRFTCYPGVEKDIKNAAHSNERVVCDGNLITSQGPGTAFDFALTLITHMDGASAANTVRRGLLLLA